jgi:CRISPR-associated Csx11 family protein
LPIVKIQGKSKLSEELELIQKYRNALLLVQAGALLHNLGKVTRQFFEKQVYKISDKFRYQHILHLIDDDFPELKNEDKNVLELVTIGFLKENFSLPIPFDDRNDRPYRPGDMIEYLGQGNILGKKIYSPDWIIKKIFTNGSRLTHLMNRAHRGTSGGEKQDIYAQQQTCLFIWNRIKIKDGIPGNDCKKLINFIKYNYNVEWAKTENITNIETIDDNNTIKVSIEKNSLTLNLNNEKTRVFLKINNHKTDEYIVKTQKKKLSVYQQKIYKSTPFGRESQSFCLEDVDRHKRCIEKIIQTHLDPKTPLQNFGKFCRKLHPPLEAVIADTQRPLNDVTVWDIGHSGMAFLLTQTIGLMATGDPIDHDKLAMIKNDNILFWRVMGIRIDGLHYLENASSIADVRVRRDLLKKRLNSIRDYLEGFPLAIQVYSDENGSFFVFPHQANNLLVKSIQDKLQSQLKVDGIALNCSLSGPLVNHPEDKGHYIGEYISRQIETEKPIYYDLKSFVDPWVNNQGNQICSACGVRPQGYGAEKMTCHIKKIKYFSNKASRRNICFICMERRHGVAERWATSGLRNNTIWVDEVADINGRMALIVGKFDMNKWEKWYPKAKDRLTNQIADPIQYLKILNFGKPLNDGEIFSLKGKDFRWNDKAQLLAGEYLFCWDDIPGNDNERLKKFLKQKFSIDLNDFTKIEKRDNGNAIKVTVGNKSHLLIFNNDKTIVIIESDDEKAHEFIVKIENNKQNIYASETADPIPSFKMEFQIKKNHKIKINEILCEGKGYKIVLSEPHGLTDNPTLLGVTFTIEDKFTLITADEIAAQKIEQMFLHDKRFKIIDRIDAYPMAESQSFARLRREWETTKHFWEESGNFSYLRTNTLRLQIIGKLKPCKQDYKPTPGPYHVYQLLFGNVKLSAVWNDDNECFITAFNLEQISLRLEMPVKNWLIQHIGQTKEIEEPTGYGSKNKLWGTITIEKVEEIPNSSYIPAIPILAEPRTFMALVPADKAIDIVNKIKNKYETEVGKVRNRLPIHMGVVFAHNKIPLRVILDAGRRMLRNEHSNFKEWIVVRTFISSDISSLPVHLQNDNHFKKFVSLELIRDDRRAVWHVPLLMGDGTTQDEWYPYIFVKSDKDGKEPSKRERVFEAPCPWNTDSNRALPGWVLHARNLHEGDKIYFTPATFDFQWLDTGGRRFEIAYDEKGYRRDISRRPYMLEELDNMKYIWKTLCNHLTITQIHSMNEMVETKREDWRITGKSEVFKQFCRDTVVNIEWKKKKGFFPWGNDRKPPGEEWLKKWTDYAESGLLGDVIELYIKILKKDPEKECEEL